MILKKAAEEGLTLKAVFLTHGHGDHIMAVPELREKTGIPVYACRAEEELLADPGQNLSTGLFGQPLSLKADVLTEDGQELTAAGMKFRVLSTPGHTPGGCCYYSEEEGVLFSGDTLFCGCRGPDRFSGRKHGNPGPLHFREADAPSRRDESVSGSSGRDDQSAMRDGGILL